MDIKTRKVIKHYNLLKDSLTVKNSTVRCIKVLQEGQVYVGTDDGIYKYDFLNDRFLYAPQFPPFAVNCIYEDRLGRIWTGMFNRSFYYNPISNTGMYLPYDKLNTQRHNFVNDACEDKDGNMWFATVEGVIKYDFQTGESLHYTVKNGMPSNVAFRILPDENETLWISTANGLVSLKQEPVRSRPTRNPTDSSLANSTITPPSKTTKGLSISVRSKALSISSHPK